MKEMTDKIEAITGMDQLNAYYTDNPSESRLQTPWSCECVADPDDASHIIIEIVPSSLLMSDSAEYSNQTALGSLMQKAYTGLAKNMLVKLGYQEEEAEQKIENCFAFEALLAQGICTNNVKKSAEYHALSNNHVSRDELKAAEGIVPILETNENADGFPAQDSYIVSEPDFLKKLNEIWTEENLPLIRDYIIVKGSINKSGKLDRECYEWVMEANNAMSGTTGSQPEEQLFATTVSNLLRWPVARLYSNTYLKEEDKARISELVEEVRKAYHGILEGADWLSEETRANAIEKLEAIHPRVLWPDDWSPYTCDGLDFASAKEGGTLFEAYTKIDQYNRLQAIRELTEPLDRSKWQLPPTTFNCFYNPADNSIYIMGCFAKGGLYSSDMPDEELYGKLGTVIGHEFSHAFDSSGAQYDKDGNLKNWWTEEDMKSFQAKNERMIAYYNAMHPWEGQDLHGVIMTGEACADMAGIKVVLQIAAARSGFDYDKFFRSYADLWAVQMTPQFSLVQLNDVHPFNYLRINAGLQQYDEFLNFYGIKEGDGMYLAPEDRVNIW